MMGSSFQLIFGAIVVAYGVFVLVKRETEIGIGGGRVAKPLFYLRLNGITAVIFAASLLFGGIAIAFPSGYELINPQPLQEDLSLWLPLIGLVIIVIGIFAATLSGVLRTAQSVGNDFYTQKNMSTPERQKDDESKSL